MSDFRFPCFATQPIIQPLDKCRAVGYRFRLHLQIFLVAEIVYTALVNFASVSTLQAKSNTLDKALLCSLWQGHTPAPHILLLFSKVI